MMARIEDIFAEAKELSAAERAGYLERACGGDATLRSEVESLLEADGEAGEFMAAPSVSLGMDPTGAAGAHNRAADGEASEAPGAIIGRYRLLERLGEGGFGAVFLAEQREPMARRVALKIIKLGMDTKQVIARFEAERQALAMMDHPGIARVLDAGATDGGRPYFVMELVRGEPITAYCDHQRLSIPERLELFREVCSAVQHAHQKGVIHRDIKPGNVMVTVVDGRPQPKVIDFGIAKAISGRLTDKTLFTELRQLIGTPEYMSPEQADTASADIDTRSDIYSLGVLLYELLTGVTPLDPQTLRRASAGEIERRIREEDPPPPSSRIHALVQKSPERKLGDAASSAPPAISARGSSGAPAPGTPVPDSQRTRGPELAQPSSSGAADAMGMPIARKGDATAPDATTVAHCRGAEPKKLAPLLRGDLDWIVMRCLEKDRSRRYATAEALAADIQRHLDHEPVEAGPPSRIYQFGKFTRKHRTPVVAGALIAAALLLAVAGTSAGLAWALREADRALAAQQEADLRAEELEKVAAFQETQLGGIDVPAMGVQLRADLIERAQASLSRSAEAGEVEGQVAELERLLAGVNFTDAALAMLETNVFDQTLAAIEEQFEGQPLVKARLLETVATSMLGAGLHTHAEAPQREALRIHREMLGDEDDRTLRSMDQMAGVVQAQGHYAQAVELCEQQLELARRTFTPADEAVMRAMNSLGLALRLAGRAADAEPVLSEALDLMRRVKGPDHADTLTCLSNLGLVLSERGAVDEAEVCYRDSLERRRRVLGDNHRDTIDSINNMGTFLVGVGRETEAEPHFREALERSRAVLGETHPDTISTLANLGAALQQGGRFAEAMPYYERALEMRRALLGNEHPQTLESLNNLGYFYSSMGRYQEAETIHRQALEINERVLGLDHPMTFASLANLATALQGQQRHAEAEEYLHETLRRQRRGLGELDPATIGTLAQIGDLLRTQGRYSEAESCLREALEGHRQTYGPEHYSTLGAQNTLARVMADQGQLEDAESLLRDSLSTARSAYGEGHIVTLSPINQLGILFISNGRFVDAEASFREELDLRLGLMDPDHPDVVVTKRNLGVALQAQGRFTEAEPFLRQALEAKRQMYGPDHATTISEMVTLANVLRQKGDGEEAEGLYREALDMQRATLEHDHPDLLITLNSIGVHLAHSGRRVEAEPYLREALQGRRSRYGENHPYTLNTMASLGELLAMIGRLEEAEQVGREAVERAVASLPADHYYPGYFQRRLGGTLARMHRFEEAQATLEEAHQRLSAVVGAEHSFSREAVMELAALYTAWHAAEPDAGHDAAAERWRAMLPPESQAKVEARSRRDQTPPTSEQERAPWDENQGGG